MFFYQLNLLRFNIFERNHEDIKHDRSKNVIELHIFLLVDIILSKKNYSSYLYFVFGNQLFFYGYVFTFKICCAPKLGLSLTKKINNFKTCD